MEAESFLADGFATRIAIQKRPTGWEKLKNLATTWQPSRLKGTVVGPNFGTPFFAATQVFDLRPTPRKWLSLDKTDNAEGRFVKPSTILLTCSGTVGRATLALNGLSKALISHDLLRIEPHQEGNWGWIFAYLRSPSIINLMQSAHYGHVIKHLEVSHLDDVPVVLVGHEKQKHFNDLAQKIFDNRNRAAELTKQAETLLLEGFGLSSEVLETKPHTSVSSREFSMGRRRLEASFHAVAVQRLLTDMSQNARKVDRLEDIVERVWWMTRFSRNFGDGGVPYMSSDELFSISQISQKKVYTDPIPNFRDFFVRKGWILMACSGQVYGLNGNVTLATQYDEKFFFSHDLIRIAPDARKVRSGYLFAYLGHPLVGQILAKRSAYGSSIPHIDPGDVNSIPVARMAEEAENQIADLAEEASRLMAEAAQLERDAGQEADTIVSNFTSFGSIEQET